MAELHLNYLNIPARGELTRLLCAYGDLPLSETRYSFREYFAAKAELDLPFNQVPTLHVDGKVFAQSIAIARYVAKRVGLYPSNALLALAADSVVDAISDVYSEVCPVVYAKMDAETRATKLAHLNTNVLPNALAALERRLAGDYFAGESLSFADIYLLDLFDNVVAGFPGQITVPTQAYPKLEALVTALRKSDKLHAYYASKL
ncbi:hypothetical protein SDRG_01595 [Saprolegnia diclina VS20]|uniref:Glutathione S-transferase n=1 Tax=Saprolegnia diclina (strain VS20) TaxID=1156394 RepID=T0SFB7_SAPDV|nr:hypothetical protein SDRG_01595 [Saprolegnia diclina VS20]EQC41637.1 hypothetical protein SDRG_01595 [Saprolegnia diclina VS20]|eukprot:XP_008605351.1 hypothetical protein SDRG_01595 [Saprolegnia diclina VS20]